MQNLFKKIINFILQVNKKTYCWLFLFFIIWVLIFIGYSLSFHIPELTKKNNFFKYIYWWFWFAAIPLSFITYFLLRYFYRSKNPFNNLNTLPPRYKNKEIPEGIILNKKHHVYLPKYALSTHTIICGSTGCGKTNLIYQFIKQNNITDKTRKIIFVNGKYEQEIEDNLAIIKPKSILINSESNQTLYNPLKGKTTKEIQSLLWELENYLKLSENSESGVLYHKDNEKILLENIIDLLFHLKITITFTNLINLLNKESCIKSILSHKKSLKNYSWLNEYDEKYFKSLKIKFNFFTKMNCIAQDESGTSVIDFINSDKKELLFFNLNIAGDIEATRLGKLICLDIQQAIFKKTDREQKVMVILDEFGSFANDKIKTLNQQGRSRGCEMVLSFQSIANLTSISENFCDDIFNNSTNKFIFTTNDPKGSEFISKSFGTKKVYEITHQIKSGSETEMGSKKLVNEFYVHPDDLKNQLFIGQCYFQTETMPGKKKTIPIKLKVDLINFP